MLFKSVKVWRRLPLLVIVFQIDSVAILMWHHTMSLQLRMARESLLQS